MSDAVDVLNGVIAIKDAEIERLRADLANMYRLHRERGALMDDLAAALNRLLEPDHLDLPSWATIDAQSTLARYREARQR